ncbi:protein of unknown function [Methylocella tundrae]|uniref:Uncharacterized protein n=1 Tax=Methylocella tundrae TaxID=227605 RepID=A0A4U8Z0W9_METTU|nr:protein of unknown function [Methylocella tundrae]
MSLLRLARNWSLRRADHFNAPARAMPDRPVPHEKALAIGNWRMLIVVPHRRKILAHQSRRLERRPR